MFVLSHQIVPGSRGSEADQKFEDEDIIIARFYLIATF